MYYSVKDFAKLVGVDPHTLYTAIREGKIAHYRIGGSIRLREEDFRVEAINHDKAFDAK